MKFQGYASNFCGRSYHSSRTGNIEPGPALAHKLFAVEVDYGDGIIINTEAYACSAEEAANQMCVKRVLYEIKESS